MPLARRRRHALRRPAPSPALGPKPLGCELFPSLEPFAPTPALVASPNNNFFQEFMRTFIEKA